MQEEDGQSYQQYFPDHFSAFADVAEQDSMSGLGDDSALQQPAAVAGRHCTRLSQPARQVQPTPAVAVENSNTGSKPTCSCLNTYEITMFCITAFVAFESC